MFKKSGFLDAFRREFVDNVLLYFVVIWTILNEEERRIKDERE